MSEATNLSLCTLYLPMMCLGGEARLLDLEPQSCWEENTQPAHQRVQVILSSCLVKTNLIDLYMQSWQYHIHQPEVTWSNLSIEFNRSQLVECLSTWSALFSLEHHGACAETPQESKLFFSFFLSLSVETNALHCGTITPANESMTRSN